VRESFHPSTSTGTAGRSSQKLAQSEKIYVWSRAILGAEFGDSNFVRTKIQTLFKAPSCLTLTGFCGRRGSNPMDRQRPSSHPPSRSFWRGQQPSDYN
jgi:hypothetical protein